MARDADPIATEAKTRTVVSRIPANLDDVVIHDRFHERFLGWLELLRDHHTISGSTAIGRISSDKQREGFVGDPDGGLYCHPTP